MSNRILLKKINYIDVKNCCVSYNKDILIQNDKIIDIGDNLGDFECEIIDCRSLFAIPSFIDMHVHITFNPYYDGDMSEKCIVANLTEAAQKGVCLVRDVGTSSRWGYNEIIMNLPQVPLPAIVMSGAPLCVKNGHGIEYGFVLNYNDISKWICNHKRQGCEWIKIMNDPENHSQKYIEKVVNTAHENNLKVACHVFRKKGIELAVSCGVDSIEHVVPIDNGYKEKSFAPYYVPTFYSAWISCRNDYLKKIDKMDASYLIEWFELLKNNFSNAIENNAKILCGTDAGCCPSSFRDIVCEIKSLYSMGMPIMSTLQSATINSAECLGYDDLYGSIDVGKYANIVVLPKNPLIDFSIMDFPCFIYLKGVKIRDEVNGPWN